MAQPALRCNPNVARAVAGNRPYPAGRQSVGRGIAVEAVIFGDGNLAVEAQPASSERIADQNTTAVIGEFRAIEEIGPRPVPKALDTGMVAFPNHNPQAVRRIRRNRLNPRLIGDAGHLQIRELPVCALGQMETASQPDVIVPVRVNVENAGRVRSGIWRKLLTDDPPTEDALHEIGREVHDPNTSIVHRAQSPLTNLHEPFFSGEGCCLILAKPLQPSARSEPDSTFSVLKLRTNVIAR